MQGPRFWVQGAPANPKGSTFSSRGWQPTGRVPRSHDKPKGLNMMVKLQIGEVECRSRTRSPWTNKPWTVSGPRTVVRGLNRGPWTVDRGPVQQNRKFLNGKIDLLKCIVLTKREPNRSAFGSGIECAEDV